MQVGDTERDIQSVLLTTDVTEAVVNEAITLGCQLIVSHHPLLYRGLKQVCGQTPQARVVETAIRHNIAIYSAHTSLDGVLNGISGRLAEKLGVQNYRILVPAEDGKTGLGVIGQLAKPMTYDAFLAHVRDTLNCTYIRYTSFPSGRRTAGGRPNREDGVGLVAMCGGAGAEFVDEAIRQGADVYLTADCKYHEMQDAAGRIGMVDIDHWVSENHARDIFRDILTPLGVKCVISKADKSPVQVLKI